MGYPILLQKDGNTYNEVDLQTITGQVKGMTDYAPLASPALTGTPTAPTAPDWTNTTQLATTAYVMKAIANSIAIENVDYTVLKSLIASGQAPTVLPVGSQIVVPWNDVKGSVHYDVPLDIVHYGDVTLQDGTTTTGMFLQWHYCTPFGIQFDNYEAFYYATSALTAGTYNFTIPTTWGKATAGTYQFTLTQDVPIGGQLAGLTLIADTAPANWKVSSYASDTTATATETVSVTSGSNGTSLGNLVPSGNSDLNSIQRVGYGYNRWSQSAIRQWLNSSDAVNAWWTPQNNYDRPPNELSTKAGFLTGFDSDFLSAIATTKVTTALNTVTDSAYGTTENTYDKIFLPSLQQMYATPQLADVEGDYWEYWKEALGLDSYAPWYTAETAYITHGIDNNTVSQYVRLRSANRGSAYYTWYVSTSGAVSNANSNSSYRSAPACVITAN